MKTYTLENLAEILEKHKAWLNDEQGGERAYLSGADLSGADLRDAYLSGAYLRGADLSGADLRDADLSGADLNGADLSGADLRDAYLSGAYLRGAYLRGADLRGADLRGAYLRGADLSGAYLRGAYLRGAYGNMNEIKSLQADYWPVTYTATHMQIGCQMHAINDWWAFDDAAISRMANKAPAWWGVWKPILQQIIAVSPAVPYATGAESEKA